jgi:hypothetical protein
MIIGSFLICACAIIFFIYLYSQVKPSGKTSKLSDKQGIQYIKTNDENIASPHPLSDYPNTLSPDKSKAETDFPKDETVASRERQLGQLINTWRQAIITKNIQQIKQLDLSIKSYGNEAIPFLRKLVLEGENERVRAFSTRVLGRMCQIDLADLFVELLEKDHGHFVRENAAWALGRLNDRNFVEILQKVAETDTSERVRQSALESIKIINSINNSKKKEEKDDQK